MISTNLTRFVAMRLSVNKNHFSCMQEGKTALILAAEEDHGSVVVALLESELGVELDYQAKVRLAPHCANRALFPTNLQPNLWSALFFASNKKHYGMVNLLHEYGADTNLKDRVCFPLLCVNNHGPSA